MSADEAEESAERVKRLREDDAAIYEREGIAERFSVISPVLPNSQHLRENAMDKTIVHFEVYGDNPARLQNFYQSLLGWKFEKMPGSMEYWLIKTVPTDAQGRPTSPGVNGGMMKRPNPEARGWVNYVAVESVDKATKEVQRLGGSVMRPKSPVPKMGWFAIVADPEHNVFALWETDSKAG